MELFLAISVIVLAIGATNADTCPPKFYPIAGRCYSFHQKKVNWHDAQKLCEKEGGKLASVVKKDTYTGLYDHIKKHYAGDYWTSGATVNGVWVWTNDGSKMDVSYFRKAPPTSPGKCAVFCSYINKFYHATCSKHKKKVICEKFLKASDEFDTKPIGTAPDIDIRAGG